MSVKHVVPVRENVHWETSINKEVPSLVYTHSLTLVLCKTKKEGGGLVSLVFWLLCLGFGLSIHETLFFGHCILVIYIEEVLLVFSLSGFSRINCCVPCDCVSFSDPLYAVLMKMC